MHKKKCRLLKGIIYLSNLLFLFISTTYIVYNIYLYKSIETSIRYTICFILLLILGIIVILYKKCFHKKKKYTKYNIFSLCLFIYIIIIFISAFKLANIFSKISNITNNTNMYSTSLITSNKDKSITKKDSIGIINDTNDYEGYILAQKLIKEKKLTNNKLIKYDNYQTLLNDLINQKISYALLPTNYIRRFSSEEGLEKLEEQTKIVYTKKEKNNNKIKNNKNLNTPFTVLIMGVDTTNDGFSSGFNSDALMIITFNPKTTNATILSIPRDTYMPISCMDNRKTKITNAGWRGEQCVAQSIEKYLDIKIDYHIKMNFNGLVSLVDAVGGIDLNIPYSFCEQNSKRQWGKNTIFVNEGKQTLNGEQALAYSRHRKVTRYMVNYCGSKYVEHSNYWNDFVRGQHQQEVINALLKKLKNIKSFNELEKILNTISNNMTTDMSTENILSLYNLAKSVIKSSNGNSIQLQKLYLQGYDLKIYDYSYKTKSGSKLTLYNYIVYNKSKDIVINTMKNNLGLIKSKYNKKFTFSIKNNYEANIVGKNVIDEQKTILMPNFIGKSIDEVRQFCINNNIKLNINESNDYVFKQSIEPNTDITEIYSLDIN